MRPLALALLAAAACAPPPQSAPGLVIANALLVDGTGGPPRRGSVRVADGRIVAVGDVAAAHGDARIDAGGLALAPGFVDTHSHADDDLPEERAALAAVSQGITTVVVGADGESAPSLERFFAALEARPAAVNVASYAGFGTLRREVMGDDYRRPAGEGEIARMRERLRAELAAGALGLSTGLEYDLQHSAPTEEVIALAREAAAAGGRYASHVRSEDRAFWEAIEEVVAIGAATGMPVHVSHLKLAMRDLLGESERLLARLDAARAAGVDITADLYPYTYWESTLRVLFPERDYESLGAARFALREITAPERMLIPRFAPAPDYEALTLAEIAERRGEDPAVALIGLIREASAFERATGREDVESVIATSMDEADVEALMRWPHASFCTDGSLRGSHPRGAGSFPRILGRYVRERGVLSLEEAVRRATSLAARITGLAGRGCLAPGCHADLVLFDPATVIDRATTDDPLAPSEGIARVWIGGRPVFADGRPTGEYPGRVLRRR